MSTPSTGGGGAGWLGIVGIILFVFFMWYVVKCFPCPNCGKTYTLETQHGDVPANAEFYCQGIDGILRKCRE